MWTKVSICLFLMRIPDSKALLRPLQWAVAFLLFSNTILTVVWIMQCQPLHAAWDDKGICMTRGALEGVILVQAVISVVSDFSFAAFPILILWRVQIDFKTKLGLWVLMCLGFITGACCLVRTVLNNQSVPLDGTYDGIVNWVWRLFEVQIGIIAACIPTLRPLFIWTTKRFKGKRSEYDPNIKFVGNESEPWTSNGITNHSRGRGDSDLRETKPIEPSPRERSTRERRDTMRDELIREGIVAAGRENTSLHPETARQQLNAHGSFSGLAQEMQKYGVDDPLVWMAFLGLPVMRACMHNERKRKKAMLYQFDTRSSSWWSFDRPCQRLWKRVSYEHTSHRTFTNGAGCPKELPWT